MSTCVTVRTKKKLEPTEIFKYLAGQGESIVCTCPEFPSVKFGTPEKAIRGVEVNLEDNGYEVRVCSFAAMEDYQLFAKTIGALSEMTGGKAYLDDEDDEEIADPTAKFDQDWIKEQRGNDFDVVRIMIAHGHKMTMPGLFCAICVGPKLFQDFEIPLTGEYDNEDREELMDFLRYAQWHCANLKDTRSRLLLTSPSGDSDKRLTVSMITIKDGKVSEFGYISAADMLVIMDLDNKSIKPLLIPFEETWKILPEGVFRALDETQYERVGELTCDGVHEMMERGRHLQPDDFHYVPTYPGEGFDEKQNTIILMWNPAISSVKPDYHAFCIENLLTEYFNWSVWEHEKAKCGDRFFLVKVGEGRTGIVMSGVFNSHPYESGDWSGRGRRTFYMDMLPNVILDPEKAPMLTNEELYKAIPSFEWKGGHSGRLLAQEDAKKLEELWAKFIQENEDSVDGVTMNVVRCHTYDSF